MHEYLDYKNCCFLNLQILKSQAHFVYAVRFWTDLFDLKTNQFFPYDILSMNGLIFITSKTFRKNPESFT